MLREILTKCSGLAIAELDLQHLPYNEQVLAVLAEGLQSVAVSKVVVDGVASGHENVHRLLEVSTRVETRHWRWDPVPYTWWRPPPTPCHYVGTGLARYGRRTLIETTYTGSFASSTLIPTE